MRISTVFSEVDVHLKDRRARADNSGYHDARLLYIMDLASSRAHYKTPSKEARDDVIPADVRRNRRKEIYEGLIPRLVARAQLQLFAMSLAEYAMELD